MKRQLTEWEGKRGKKRMSRRRSLNRRNNRRPLGTSGKKKKTWKGRNVDFISPLKFSKST